MKNLDRITINPKVCLGQPTIRGMRITVSVILKMLAGGKSVAEVLEAYPELEEEDVLQSLRYAAWVVSDQVQLTSMLYFQKLGPKARKGSKPRCHWLTHGTREQVAKRLTELIEPYGKVSVNDHWMPEGFCDTQEAQLDKACKLLPKQEERDELRKWWLEVTCNTDTRRRTPNWDIASTCKVNGEDGLLVVEAKAHTGELKVEDKTGASQENLQRIVAAIQEANIALADQTGLSWALSHECRYQMSNRFAWSWKLAELGYPVILVYLGFLKAEEMRPNNFFSDHANWAFLIKKHSQPLFPEKVWNNKWKVHDQLFVPLIRSRDIPYDAPVE